MSSAYAISFGFVFAAVPALIVHAILYHGNVADVVSFLKKFLERVMYVQVSSFT